MATQDCQSVSEERKIRHGRRKRARARAALGEIDCAEIVRRAEMEGDPDENRRMVRTMLEDLGIAHQRKRPRGKVYTTLEELRIHAKHIWVLVLKE
jgi:hypothetical protein